MRSYGETFSDYATRISRKWSRRSSRGEDCLEGRMSLSEWKRIKRQPKRRERQQARKDVEQDLNDL